MNKKLINKPSQSDYEKLRFCNLSLSQNMIFARECDMPQIKPYDGQIPKRFIPFSTALSSKEYDCGVHFFIDDFKFERLWRSPEKYIAILKRFSCVIAPDFSIFVDSPTPVKLWNSYRNKFIASLLQSRGVNVIPNISWAEPHSYDYTFSGEPKESIVAVCSLGALGKQASKYLWQRGYKEALARLNPKLIVRYGQRLEGEREDISVYIENENLKRASNGC